MNEPIYFSKVMFTEGFIIHSPRSVILLDLPNRELSYQLFSRKRNMPAIQGEVKDEFWSKITGEEHIDSFSSPARVTRNGKTDFKAMLLKEDAWEENVEFSYGIKLSQQQYEEILPYCNALEFEPYRNKKMTMHDEGYRGYRDEISVSFCGITDSYIPYLELPMSYYYDEAHTWPSEKLYRHIHRTFLDNDKKLKGKVIGYGALSLFGG